MKQSALLAGTPLMVGAFGSFVSGWISPHLSRWLGDVRRARRIIGAVGCVGAALLLVAAGKLTQPALAVAAIACVAFFNDIQMPGAWTACMDVGGFLSPIICGYIVQTTGNWSLVFYVTAAMYVLGIFFWLAMDSVTPLEQQEKNFKA